MIDKIIKAVKEGHNICITGGGGVGKTYTMNKLREELGVPITMTATTGLAALHVRGQTIHSLTCIGTYHHPDDLKHLRKKEYFMENCGKVLEHIEKLGIDEISMMRRDQFDLINEVLKYAKTSKKVFGGIQMIVIGDFLQLPPVVKRRELDRNQWVFQSQTWKDAEFKIFNLTEVKRQSDEDFIEALNMVRFGLTGMKVERMFRQRLNIENEAPIKLMARNKDVDAWNEKCLAEIEGEEIIIPGLYTFHENLQPCGDPEEDPTRKKERKALYYQVKKSINVPEITKLKVGCRVLICKNDSEQGFVNGSMGHFVIMGLFINTMTKKYEEIAGLLEYLGIPFVEDDEWGRIIRLEEMPSKAEISRVSQHLKWGDFAPTLQLKIELDDKRIVYLSKNDYGIRSTRFFDYQDVPEDEITFHQFPIRLGYAITIHKSQGMTLEQVEVNFEGCFAPGAVYVALSRAKTLEGLYILNWSQNFVKADPAAVQFYNNLLIQEN